MNTLELDGSRYSGSGTIVRTGLTFAALKNIPLRIVRIREKRPSPGLRAQHVTFVHALSQLAGGRVAGLGVGAQELIFFPGKRTQAANYEWYLGPWGSATLLAVALLPLLIFSPEPAFVRVRGGLRHDYAPSPEHLEFVLMPSLLKMGVNFRLKIHEPDEIKIEIGPLETPLKPVRILEETVNPFLADQLIPYAALAEGESEYLLPEMTGHVESNLWLIETLLGASYRRDGLRLKIQGIALAPSLKRGQTPGLIPFEDGSGKILRLSI